MEEEEQRWLTTQEQQSWIPFVSLLISLPGALDAQLQRDNAITLYEYLVLSVLSEVGGEGLRMNDLAVLTAGAPSRLSQVVSRMEDRNWVRRVPDPNDGRATLVHLISKGKEKLAQAAPGHVGAVKKYVYDNLKPRQVEQLRKISFSIATNILPPDSLLHRHHTNKKRLHK